MNHNKSDVQLKQEIEAELRWDPKVNASQIGVSVDQGAVSLLGQVDTYAGICAAEEAARRVGGVRDVAQSLTVKLLPHHAHSDQAIAEAASRALTWDVFVPAAVTATVVGGAITLGGVVEWNFQRQEALRAVRNLAGVVAVNNNIILQPEPSALGWRGNLQAALQRQATMEAPPIHVENSGGGTVTLTGRASSWQAISDAVHVAWASPGVTEVIDRVVRPMSD